MVEEAIHEQTPRIADVMPAPDHRPEDAAAHGRDVAPCFIRFAEGELTGERVGRVGLAIFPSLGEAYEREVAQADDARRGELFRLVVRGLAIGYAFIDRSLAAGGDEEFVERPAKSAWDAWTNRLNAGMLEGVGAPPETIRALRSAGSSGFREMGKAAGLRGRKLKRIGAYYAQAGGELRMVQSQADLIIKPSPWPFDRFPSV
jgi:hypothetical protein